MNFFTALLDIEPCRYQKLKNALYFYSDHFLPIRKIPNFEDFVQLFLSNLDFDH